MSLVSQQDVRDYMRMENVNNSQYSDATLYSNIQAAAEWLERATARYFEDRTQTLTFSSDGKPIIHLPGLRTATTIAWSGSTLVADQSYWLIPDVQQTGVFVGVQLRAFTARSDGPAWLHSSEWFDRNLDSPWYPGNYGGGFGGLPNDISVAGTWGYTAVPYAVRHAAKILAAYFTKRPDALLSGGIQTPEGSVFDLSSFPIEVKDFVRGWKVGEMAVVV